MDSPVLCKCDNEARRVTVKKEGKNKGREFWQCKGIEKRCGLLLWIDEMEKSNTKKQNDTKSTPEKKSENGKASESTDSPPLCKCGNNARRVTVKKEGKNKGREFWQCKGVEKRCGLLIWITPENKSNDTDNQNDTKSSPKKDDTKSSPKKDDTKSSPKKDKAEAASESTDSNPLCKCEKESRRLTVKKEGKNQGREFYQCKGVDKRCGFFKWIDANEKPAAEKSPSKRKKESESESDSDSDSSDGDKKKAKVE